MRNLCDDLKGIHQSHVSTLSGWVSPLSRPYSPGYVFPLPFDVTTFAFWDFLFPLENSAFLTVGLPVAWTPSGFPSSAFVRYDRVGCPLYSGVLVSVWGSRCYLPTDDPIHRFAVVYRWSWLTELTYEGSLSFILSVFPLPVVS